MHADYSVELGRDDAALELPWSSADPAVRYHDLKKHPELLREIPEAMAHPELGAFLARINAVGFPLATAKCDAWTSREVAKEEEIFGDRKFVSYIDLVFEDQAGRRSFERHEAFAKSLCRLLSQAPEIPAAVEVVIRRCYYHGEGGADEMTEEGEVGAEAEYVEIEFAAEGGAGVGGGDAVEVEFEAGGDAGAEDFAEQQSGAAIRECTDRVTASEGTGQETDIGHRMEHEDADAEERFEADIEEAETVGRLDETVTDEGSGLGSLGGAVSGFCFTVYGTGFGDNDHEPRLRWQIALALLQNALVQLAKEQ